MSNLLLIFLAGIAGAVVKELLDDNALELPKKIDGKLCLGSLGGFLIGGVAGYLIDGSPLTAFLAGYSGTGVLTSLITQKKTGQNGEVETIIRYVARQELVNPELCVKVAKCESNLNPQAVNINKDGSKDRGLFQWNDKYHPEVSDADAFSAEKSTKLFCKAFKEGHLSWWSASKKCWG